MFKRFKRIRCWFWGYHERGQYKFRYDVHGMCEHCGKVGSGEPWPHGE